MCLNVLNILQYHLEGVKYCPISMGLVITSYTCKATMTFKHAFGQIVQLLMMSGVYNKKKKKQHTQQLQQAVAAVAGADGS